MKRIMLLLTVAATMGAMVVLTASGAVAQADPLQEFCAAQEAGQVTTGMGPPTCTFTVTTSVPAQHGFMRSTSQVFTLTITQLLNNQDPTLVEDIPPVESCQNPGGRDVDVDNPNCRLAV